VRLQLIQCFPIVFVAQVEVGDGVEAHDASGSWSDGL
jgi:hypothetical protein